MNPRLPPSPAMVLSVPLPSARNVWLVLLTVAWVLAGLVGHDPWKPDEAYTFGIVHELNEDGNWAVPSLAGEPFVEKPPLFFMVAVASLRLWGSLLPAHDAARLATGLFVALGLLFLFFTERELWGNRRGLIAVLALLGCAGSIARLHQLITDAALFTGTAMGMYGLALGRRSAWRAGTILGLGAACGFLSKNALHAYSPQLFAEWLFTNNFARFLGDTRLGPHNFYGFYASVLPWYAFPALPLAAWALWTEFRRSAVGRAHPGIQLPFIVAAVISLVLATASDSRDLYLVPLLLPLSLLAAEGVLRLPESMASLLSLSARGLFGCVVALLWLGWIALELGTPAVLRESLLAYQPGYQPSFHALPFLIGAVATMASGAYLARPTLSGRSAMAHWTVGLFCSWFLMMTIWLPFLDAGKSYRSMVESLSRQLPQEGCIASLNLGEPQRAMLDYYADVETIRMEKRPEAACRALLVQGWKDSGAPAPDGRWFAVWEGARPGDSHEFYRLYVRDAKPAADVVRFPSN